MFIENLEGRRMFSAASIPSEQPAPPLPPLPGHELPAPKKKTYGGDSDQGTTAQDLHAVSVPHGPFTLPRHIVRHLKK